jgi:tetratricopeptide (TPR) repeat protein
MKISNQTIQQLNHINHCLLNGDGGSVEKILTNGSLERLLSQEAIAFARVEDKKPLILLLCTLAANNDVEPERAQQWLDVYQSIVNKQLTPSLANLPNGNVRKETAQSCITGTTHTATDIQSFKGSKREWLDSIELCMDLNQWQMAEIMVCNTTKFNDKYQWYQELSKNLADRYKHYVNEQGVQLVNVSYKTLSKLYEACSKYANQYHQIKLTMALQQLEAGTLEMDGRYEEALKTLKKLEAKSNSLSIQFSLSRIYCKLKKYDNCIEYLDKSIDALAHEKINTEANVREEAKEHTKDHDFEVLASRALRDLAIISNNKNIPFFLVSGTLLGYAREGKLLTHDKDIDVGIIGWENQYELSLAIKQSGLFNLEIGFLKGQKTYFIPIRHIATGVCIDIFVYHEDQDKLITGVDFFFGHQQTFAFSKFNLNKVNFLGVEMYIPDNFESNLEENFGDWRHPDKGYISHLESPSTMNLDGYDYQITLRMQILGAIKSKDIEKLMRIEKIMQQSKKSADDQLISKLEQNIVQFKAEAV